jgi:protein Mpv17
MLNDKPIITKAITSFCTFGGGDLICQTLENASGGKKGYQFKRYFIQASFGFFFAFYAHTQFCIIMPKLFPPGPVINVVKSVVYDQTVNSVIFTTGFFTYIDFFSGKNKEEIKQEIKTKLWPTLLMNWSIWPFLMAINFSVVPSKYRVLFANINGMFWVAYMSYVQNVKSKNKNKK